MATREFFSRPRNAKRKDGKDRTTLQHLLPRKDRAVIEVALTHKVPARAIASRFGVSKDAVQRHGADHLSPVMRAAILAHQKPQPIDLEQLGVESEGLLAQLVTQRARLQTHSELAASMGDVRGAVAAENAITSNLSLVGKLLGQLVSRHDVRHTSILVSPDYLKLRAVLTAALPPVPPRRPCSRRGIASAGVGRS